MAEMRRSASAARVVLAALIAAVWCGTGASVTVLAPQRLRGGLRHSTALFGLPYSTVHPVTARAVLAQPLSGCSPLTNADAVRGNVCLVERSGCVFARMAEVCQDAGAAGVVVLHNVTGELPFVMSAGETPPNVHLLVAMVEKRAGDAIRNALQTEPVLLSLGYDISSRRYP